MTDKKILEIFEEFKGNYSSEKGCEISRIVTFFCLYIKRQENRTQQWFKDFFIRELATNAHQNQNWAVDILIKLNDNKLISDIYRVFHKYSQKNRCYENTLIKGRIFLLLIKLKDNDVNHASLYYDFVEQELKEQLFLYQNAFFLNLLVEYLAINFRHSLEILSDYYARLTFAKTSINESNIFIPCLFFSQNSCLHMEDLLTMTYRKNQQSGLQLKKLFTDFAKHSPVKNKEEWNNMQNMILQLNSFFFN